MPPQFPLRHPEDLNSAGFGRWNAPKNPDFESAVLSRLLADLAVGFFFFEKLEAYSHNQPPPCGPRVARASALGLGLCIGLIHLDSPVF